MMKKLNAKEFSDLLWILCVLAAMICCTAMGYIDVPTCLGFVFVLLLNMWNVVDGAKVRLKAESQIKEVERIAHGLQVNRANLLNRVKFEEQWKEYCKRYNV